MKSKKWTIALIFIFFMAVFGISSAAGAEKIKILLNGKEITGALPIVENGRIFVPLRLICENIGAEVLWSKKDKTVFIKHKEPFSGPLGSIVLAQDVSINEDGTWDLIGTGIHSFNTGYNVFIAYYTADDLSPGMHRFKLSVIDPEGTEIKSLLDTYEAGNEGEFMMFEEIGVFLPRTGKYYVLLHIDGELVSKTAIFAEEGESA